MRGRAIPVIAIVTALLGIHAANAAAEIPSGVTIHYLQKKNRLYGYVFSRHPNVCAAGRSVTVFKKRQNRNRRHAKRIGVVSAGERVKSGKTKWRLTRPWSELTTGKYFARTGRPHRCEADYSKTIHITVRQQAGGK